MNTEDVRKAFAEKFPDDDAILSLSENNRAFMLDSIGARHRFTAFSTGWKSAISAQPVSAGLTDAREMLSKLVDTYFTNNCGENVFNLMSKARALLSAAQRDSQPVADTSADAQTVCAKNAHTVDTGSQQPSEADARDAALAEVIAFLMGEGPLDGLWFGDVAEKPRPRFWWRSNLRAAIAASRET